MELFKTKKQNLVKWTGVMAYSQLQGLIHKPVKSKRNFHPFDDIMYHESK